MRDTQHHTRARHIRIDDDLWAAIRDLAEAQDRTPSAIVRLAIREYLTAALDAVAA